MKKILVFGVGSGVGGVGNFIMDIYRNINHKELQFDFVISGKDSYFAEEIYKLGGHIYYVTPRNESFLKNLRDLFNTLRKHHDRYDVVYFNLSQLYYIFPFIISILFNFPTTITHAHASKPYNVKKNLRYYLHILNRNFVVKKSDYLFACSPLAMKWIFGENEFIRKNTIIVPNGINVKKYVYDKKIRLNMRNQLSISNEEFVVGHVGRLSFEKNHLFLLDIFKEVKKKKKNAKLLLVGDGNYKEKIEDKIEKLGLKNNVILTGSRSDVPELLNVMDVFVFPSLYEGFGIALIEAQATGLQSITTKGTVPQEVDVTGNITFMELSKSPKVWAEEIIKNADVSERKDLRNVIKSSGYDVVDVAEKFHSFIKAIE